MTKKEKYRELLVEIGALTDGVRNKVGALGNVCALIKEKMEFFWVGFYIVACNDLGEKELQLGPFQGTIACYSIGYGKGVCGQSWKEKKSIVVDDVEQFPGHIACSSISKSEIVVPIWNSDNGEVVGVLDIDSEMLATFDDVDREYLEEICNILSDKLFSQ